MVALTVAAVALAYLAGSIPFGVVFARARGVDLRAVGSGNIGATNAARALGRRMGVVVFLCDAAKGAVPVLVVAHLAGARPGGDWATAATGAAAFLGHLTSPFVGFRGGKGVATAFGVFLAIAPAAALIAGALFAVLYATTRIASIGSLAAATAFVPALWLLAPSGASLALALFMWALIVLRHRGNIARLLRRQERRA
jgi:glycerol-3-phosphate acyltransferase PlsY